MQAGSSTQQQGDCEHESQFIWRRS